jgi:integrase
VTRDHLVRCLRPIWLELKETAARLRGRIESVLAFAEVKGWRPEGSNPAALKPITIALGKQRRRPRRQPALPVDQMAEFMADLRARDSRSARALELLILCAVRSNEVLEATWDEFKIADDWRSGNWLIRGERMKGTSDRKYSHIVPLSPAALALLRKVYERRTGALVFGLSSAALEKMVDIMNGDRAKAGKPTYADPDQDNRAIVPHGFRSTFRDWAGDNTDADHETIEFALAHGISDKTEVAYRRTTAIEKRRKLMKQWAEFCSA